MKILVVSDSHGDNESLDRLLKMYPEMDLYIHAGDFETDTRELSLFRCVKGNCDYFSDALERLIIPIEGGTIIVQHKPQIDTRILKENNCKIFIHGHTHKRRDEIIDGIRYINPGAIAFARDGNYLSYAILHICESGIFVTFKSLSDNL